MCDEHSSQQTQGSDVRGHQGRHSDELQAGRGALGRQDPHEGHDDHRVRHVPRLPPPGQVRGGGGGEHEPLPDQVHVRGPHPLHPAAGARGSDVSRHRQGSQEVQRAQQLSSW